MALISEGANGEGEEIDLSTMLYFYDEATEEWDKWDAEKIYPLKTNFSLLNIMGTKGDEQVAKAQDSRVFENLGDEIFLLNVEALNVKPQHSIKWNNSKNVPEEWVFYFMDNETDEEIKMDENFSYNFQLADKALAKNKSAALQLSKSLTVNSEDESPPSK